MRELKCNTTGCLILAGPATGGSNFALYSWSGTPTDAPQLRNDLSTLAAEVEGSFESIVDLPGGNLTSSAVDNADLQLLSDNGDTIYYLDGTIAKDQPRGWQKSRSDVVKVASAAICTVNSVTVSPSSASVNIGASANFSATVNTTPANCPVYLSWTSSDTGKATINALGIATGVAGGPTNIVATATAAGGSSAQGTAALTVNSTQDFTLTASAPLPVSAGVASTTTSNLTVTRTSFTDPVSITLSSVAPSVPGIVLQSSPVNVTGNSTTLSFTVAASVPAGIYTLTLQGVGGSPALTRTTTISLTVTGVAPTLANVVVYRVGDGSAALTSAATPAFLDVYDSGAANQTSTVQTVALPTATSGANRTLTNSGTATSEGQMTRSSDGKCLVFAGYEASPGTLAVTGTASANTNRIVGLIKAGTAAGTLGSSTLDTTTRINDGYNQNNIRSATSDTCAQFWTSGAGTTTGGVRYVTLGGTGTSTQLSGTVTNTRNVGIFGGQLYASSAAGSNSGINTVGTGLPTTSGQTISVITGLNPGAAYGFVFLKRSASTDPFDTLYVADQANGLLKYSFANGTWTARGNIPGSLFGLTGQVLSNSAVLYAINGTGVGNQLVRLDDTAVFDATITGTFQTLATSSANTVFRGVAFAPNP